MPFMCDLRGGWRLLRTLRASSELCQSGVDMYVAVGQWVYMFVAIDKQYVCVCVCMCGLGSGEGQLQ